MLFLLITGFLLYDGLLISLNYPVAPVMSETKTIPAGFSFRFVYSYSFNWCNYSVPAGITLYHPHPYHISAYLKPFWPCYPFTIKSLCTYTDAGIALR